MTRHPIAECSQGIRVTLRVFTFLLHNALLVPGIVLWALFLLLQGDIAALMAFGDNLTSRYGTSGATARHEFLQIAGAVFSVIFIFLITLRWPLLLTALGQGEEAEKPIGDEND